MIARLVEEEGEKKILMGNTVSEVLYKERFGKLPVFEREVLASPSQE